MDFLKCYPKKMKSRLRVMTLLAMLCAVVTHANAHQHAHTHGLLQLDVAIDAQSITLQFESPLDNFLGFEHTPRTDQERRKVADMVASLKAAEGLFFIDPAAECRQTTTELGSAALGLGSNNESPSGQGKGGKRTASADEHADIDATIVFTCKNASAAQFIAVKLFERYPHLHTVNAHIASPKKQFKRTLKADSPKLDLSQ